MTGQQEREEQIDGCNIKRGQWRRREAKDPSSIKMLACKTCIQVTSLHRRKKQGINRKILIGNRFHVNTTHRQSYHLQTMLTGVKR